MEEVSVHHLQNNFLIKLTWVDVVGVKTYTAIAHRLPGSSSELGQKPVRNNHQLKGHCKFYLEGKKSVIRVNLFSHEQRLARRFRSIILTILICTYFREIYTLLDDLTRTEKSVILIILMKILRSFLHLHFVQNYI